MDDPTVLSLPTVDALVRFVRDTLCSHDRLDPMQTPMFQTAIDRDGRVCGFVYHVEGPRQLRTSALWDQDDQRILFYDSTGTRINEVRMVDGPELPTRV